MIVADRLKIYGEQSMQARKLTILFAVPTLTVLLSACSVVTGISSSCNENKADGTRMCTTIDSNQNVTTRSIERNQKLFISTCSNGNCTEYREVGGSSGTVTPAK
jgi:hypothetical protein